MDREEWRVLCLSVGKDRIKTKGRTKIIRSLIAKGFMIANPSFTSAKITKAGEFVLRSSNMKTGMKR